MSQQPLTNQTGGDHITNSATLTPEERELSHRILERAVTLFKCHSNTLQTVGLTPMDPQGNGLPGRAAALTFLPEGRPRKERKILIGPIEATTMGEALLQLLGYTETCSLEDVPLPPRGHDTVLHNLIDRVNLSSLATQNSALGSVAFRDYRFINPVTREVWWLASLSLVPRDALVGMLGGVRVLGGPTVGATRRAAVEELVRAI